jgi:hypothetical protein
MTDKPRHTFCRICRSEVTVRLVGTDWIYLELDGRPHKCETE